MWVYQTRHVQLIGIGGTLFIVLRVLPGLQFSVQGPSALYCLFK